MILQVERNVELVKGLFSESLPAFLKEQERYAGGNQTVSYLHIDCDLYAGSRDAFTILSEYIKPGTVILFDELVSSQEHIKTKMAFGSSSIWIVKWF